METDEYTYHVATVDEEEDLLPVFVRKNCMVEAQDNHLEPVWMVCDQTGTIENGYIMDTEKSMYFTFEVMVNEEGFSLIPTSDWKPCDTDESDESEG